MNTRNKFKVIHEVTDSITENTVQQKRIVMGLHTLKECNKILTKTLSLTLSTDDMSVYKHLVQLDFIKEADSSKTMFGSDFEGSHFPHTQTILS